MTQIGPAFGVAPDPTVLSIICKPEAVVMVFPAVWAAAPDGAAKTKTPTVPIATAKAIGRLRNGKRRIFSASFLTEGELACAVGTPQYPSALPSLRGSEPPVSVPLSQSIQIAWPPPSGGTTLVVLCPSFFRPSTISAGTPSSS